MKSKREKEKEILNEFKQFGRVDRLVREYWKLVFFTVRETLLFHKVHCTNEDVEDLRTEVFLQLFKNDYRRLRQYDRRKGLSLSAWIKLVANHTTLNEIRKRGLLDLGKRNFQIPIEDIEEVLTYDERERFDARENLRITMEAMEKLSPRDREILRQYFLECKCLKDIAASFDKPYGTASAIVSRAKKRLKKLIGKKISV